jgi:hypothetical protein
LIASAAERSIYYKRKSWKFIQLNYIELSPRDGLNAVEEAVTEWTNEKRKAYRPAFLSSIWLAPSHEVEV